MKSEQKMEQKPEKLRKLNRFFSRSLTSSTCFAVQSRPSCRDCHNGDPMANPWREATIIQVNGNDTVNVKFAETKETQ